MEAAGKLAPEIYQAILDCLEDGVYLVDLDRKIAFWNRGAEQITGFRRQEVLGRSCEDQILVHCRRGGDLLSAAECPLLRTLADGKIRSLDLFLRHRDGHCIPVRMRTAPVHDATGKLVGAAEIFEHSSQASGRQSRGYQLGVHGCLDALTGAAGSAYARTYLAEQLAEFETYELPLAVLRADIDGLGQVNRSRGREAGNAVLRMVARTLADSLSDNGLVARLEEDEFLVILTNYGGETLQDLAERSRVAVSLSAVPWWGDQFSVEVSIGAAAAEHGDTVEALLARAGEMLARSKAQGGHRVTLSGKPAAGI